MAYIIYFLVCAALIHIQQNSRLSHSIRTAKLTVAFFIRNWKLRSHLCQTPKERSNAEPEMSDAALWIDCHGDSK